MPTQRKTIGFILASLHTGASQALLPGMLDAAEKADVNLICFPGGRLRASEDFEDQRNVVYDLVGGETLAGLVTWASSLGGAAGPREINLFHQRFQSLPMVSLSRMLDGVPTVSIDSYRGMRALLSHLIEVHGYQRLAFVRGPEKHNPAQERYRAYLDTLETYRLPIDPHLVTRPLRWEDGAEAIRILLDERGLQPTVDFQAIVTVSDLMAVWVLKALQERGYKIPAEVVVTGFNNSMEERLATPPLTTVELPFYAQGKRAIELLLTHLAGDAVPALITLPSELILRQSCGCPSGAVLQAGVSRSARKTTGDLSFTETRAACLAEMSSAAGLTSPHHTIWLESVLDTFVRDTQNIIHAKVPTTWLPALEDALDQAMHAGIDIYRWHTVLSVMRDCVLIGLPEFASAMVEALLAQGRILISEAIQRAHTYRQWQTERQNETLRQAILALLTAVDLECVSEVLVEFLPQMGIPSIFLALYENPTASLETARLVLAYSDQHRLDLEHNIQCFPARQIVPPALLPSTRRYDLIVEPLFFQESQLGFLVLEMGPREGNIYELLRANLSSALHSATLFQEIEYARLTAEKADRIKTMLLANVSHELRTPLNIITGYTQNALERSSAENSKYLSVSRDELGHIQNNAEHLLRIINDLLDISRAEIDELDLILELLDPHPLLCEAFQNMADQYARPAVRWLLQLPTRLPLVHADALRLRQIIFNLLSNAAKFTEQGEICLGAAVEPPYLQFWVADSGSGMTPEEQEHIFEPFITGGNTQRQTGGIGLGLSITRHLVMLHDGRIKVESRPGQGSKFQVYLPLPVLTQSRPSSDLIVTPTLVLISHAPQPAQEILELSQRQNLEIYHLNQLDELDSMLTQLQPVVLAWDLSGARPADWHLIRRLRHYPNLGQAPLILYGQTSPDETVTPSLTIGLTSILVKPSSEKNLLDAIVALCPQPSNHPILIVDDDKQVQASHRTAVTNHLPDYPIQTANDGAEALALMSTEAPVLVLLDLMMPGLSGFDVLDQMRSSEHLRSVPVIILSNKVLNLDDLKRLESHARVTYQSKGLWSETEIAAALHRALFGEEALPPHTSALVKRAVTYLNENFTRPLSRWEIAESVGVSEDYLSRVFSRELGLTPWDYLNRYRILQARQLLRQTSESIGWIARQVGFKDQSYFSRVFHKLAGTSPQAFRETDHLSGI